MFSHGHARRAVLLLMVLAVAVLWTAGQGIRAAANDRAESSAIPSKTAEKAVTGTTVKEPPPATTAKADTTAKSADKAVAETTVTEPAPATAAAPAPQSGKAKGKVTRDQAYVEKFKRIAPSEQRKAALLAAKRGLKPGIAGMTAMGLTAAATPDPGGVPHYFGPYGNWAFSPLPKGPVGTVSVVDGGTGYTAPVVTVTDAYLDMANITPADVTAAVGAGGAITGFTIVSGGAGYRLPSSPSLTPRARARLPTRSSAAPSRTKPASASSSTPAAAWARRSQQPWPVHPGCELPRRARIAVRPRTATRSPWSSTRRRCTRTCPPTKLRGYVQLSTTGSVEPCPV